MPLPSWQVWSVVVVVLDVVVGVVSEVVVVDVDVVDVVVVVDVVDVVDVVVVLLVDVDVVVLVVDVVVELGVRTPTTEFTQSLTVVSRVALVLALEQSVADASLAIASANLLSAVDRQSEGSEPLVACFDRHWSLADAFFAAAATFFESHLLAGGAFSLVPTAEMRLLSHASRSPRTAPALPGHEVLDSAFVNPFVSRPSSCASQDAPSPAVPLASALESHLSASESALPEVLSFAPLHLSARASAGGRRHAVASRNTRAERKECMSGWPPRWRCAGNCASLVAECPPL
jgi:hypothetical protein